MRTIAAIITALLVAVPVATAVHHSMSNVAASFAALTHGE